MDEDGTERLSSEKLVHVLDKLGASPAQAAEVHALFESALRGGAAVDAETFFNVMSCTSLHATLQPPGLAPLPHRPGTFRDG